MKRLISLTGRPGLIGLLIVGSLILAACAPATAAGNPTAAVPVTGSFTLQSADNPQLGKLLVTAEGMTLYTFSIDTPQASNCNDSDCVSFWPPLSVTGEPTAGPDITGSLGTITRSDGTPQLTYNDMPLYTFSLDTQPGDVKGDNLDQFGGIWHVVLLEGSSSGSSNNSTGGSGGYQ